MCSDEVGVLDPVIHPIVAGLSTDRLHADQDVTLGLPNVIRDV
jgi:hypothetical protein